MYFMWDYWMYFTQYRYVILLLGLGWSNQNGHIWKIPSICSIRVHSWINCTLIQNGIMQFDWFSITEIYVNLFIMFMKLVEFCFTKSNLAGGCENGTIWTCPNENDDLRKNETILNTFIKMLVFFKILIFTLLLRVYKYCLIKYHINVNVWWFSCDLRTFFGQVWCIYLIELKHPGLGCLCKNCGVMDLFRFKQKCI